ncbi:MAG: hypothetical protein HZA51_15095 [Planctomycetes bacterium]|nr:hypothetical protein [Planctomycetota bacterium]
MDLRFDSDTQKIIDEKVASGQYSSPEDVPRAALAALQFQESYGQFSPGELDRLIAEGEASLLGVESIPASEAIADIRGRFEKQT